MAPFVVILLSMNLYKLISFKADKRIFTLFCGLYSTKANYFAHISDKKLGPFGKRIKHILFKKRFKSTSKLRKYFEREHPYYFIIWVLQHSNPPQFKKLYKKWEGEFSLSWYKSFGETLREFCYEANISQLWRGYQEEASREINKYRKITLSVLQEILEYLRIEKLPFKKIILIPNLLDAIGAGYGPVIGKKIYIIFSPTNKEGPNIQLLRHEFLHSIINPLIQKKINKEIIKRDKQLIQGMITSPALEYYNDLELIIIEYILRAIELRLLPSNKKNQYIQKQIKLGFPQIEFFDSQLKIYEKEKKNFSRYLPDILRNIKYLS